jgi:hypothetical protein
MAQIWSPAGVSTGSPIAWKTRPPGSRTLRAHSARERHPAQAGGVAGGDCVFGERWIVMARARGDIAPLDRVGRGLERLVRDATETT